MAIYIVEHKDGAFTFWTNIEAIRGGVHQIKKIYEVPSDFTVGEIIDNIILQKETSADRLKEVGI